MAPEICHLFHWSKFSNELLANTVREFIDHGSKRFVFCFHLADKILHEDPSLEGFLQDLCRKTGVEFVAMHGLCGRYHDLNIPDEEEHKTMIREHIRAMELAARFGSKTYTVHVGAYFYCTEHLPLPRLRKNAARSLEELIPEAERLNIVLAVENSFEPPNSAREVVDLVKPFLSSKAIGYCYDSGHANCMRTAPGKTSIEDYTPYFKKAWWEGLVQENNALELFRDRVVTCHLHDNDGRGDLHCMPGDGTLEWDKLMPELLACPNMLEFQSEVNCFGGTNYAGTSPAPEGGYSVKRLTDAFRKLGFE